MVFTGPLRYKLAPDAAWPRMKVLLFLSGLVITYLTVGSPLDQLGESFLFSLHMIQHNLLIYVMPVFFFFGVPSWLLDSLITPLFIRRIARILVKPVVAGALFTGCFTVWHVPVLYEAALKSKAIHILEHWTMFGTALLMWWPIISPSKLIPASSYGVRMIYIFLLMVGQLPVFGVLTFSSNVLYPTYEFAPRLEFFNLTPLEDQTMGGVIMKVANMIVSMAVFCLSFYLWARHSERNTGDTLQSARS